MKLSNAILKGCEIAPLQAFRSYTSDQAACALGAAYLGAGAVKPGERVTLASQLRLGAKVGASLFTTVQHPETGRFDDVPTIVIELNDRHRWTREKIAGWLAGLGM